MSHGPYSGNGAGAVGRGRDHRSNSPSQFVAADMDGGSFVGDGSRRPAGVGEASGGSGGAAEAHRHPVSHPLYGSTLAVPSHVGRLPVPAATSSTASNFSITTSSAIGGNVVATTAPLRGVGGNVYSPRGDDGRINPPVLSSDVSGMNMGMAAAMLVGGMNTNPESMFARAIGTAPGVSAPMGMVGMPGGGMGGVGIAGVLPTGPLATSTGAVMREGGGVTEAGGRGKRGKEVDIGPGEVRNIATGATVGDWGGRPDMGRADAGLGDGAGGGRGNKRRKGATAGLPDEVAPALLPLPVLPQHHHQQQQQMQQQMQQQQLQQLQQQLAENGEENKTAPPGPDSSSNGATNQIPLSKQQQQQQQQKPQQQPKSQQRKPQQELLRVCQHMDCRRGPCYGWEGERRATFCASHRLPGQVNVVSPRCAREGCRLGPSYGQPGVKKPVFCSGHRLPGQVNVVSPRCQHLGCSRGPSYGHSGDVRKPMFCAGHRLFGMVNVVSPQCREENCTRGPSYGFEGERASFCAKHKQDGQVNVVSRRCKEEGCRRGPSYGLEGDRRASYCAKHKREGMINIVSRKCFAPGCGKGPSFGREGDRKAAYCALHKREGDINLANNVRFFARPA